MVLLEVSNDICQNMCFYSVLIWLALTQPDLIHLHFTFDLA